MQLKTSNSNAKTESTLVNLSSPQGLLSTLQELRQTVESEGKATFNQWRSHIQQLNRPPIEFFFEGDRLLKQHTAELFGQSPPQRRVRIMVTLPTEAATDYEMVLAPHHKKRVFKGDRILLLRCEPKIASKAAARKADAGDAIPSHVKHFQTSCTVPEILDLLVVDNPVYIDDGKIQTRVVDTQHRVHNGQGILLEVTNASPKGVKLRPQKGLNFPDTVLPLSPLTEKDLSDLDFVATHADIIGYSFVQRPADIELLQQELDQRLVKGQSRPAIVAKIETAIAVANLPELIIYAAGKQSFGVMIARGDLAVEIGYQRLTEIQEEILWLCEAAHIPVIWATQVLESLVKNGTPSRGEMTDAAMAERAECVMLNKGPFIAEAIAILDDVLTRMEAHQSKKTPQLRALHSW